MQILFVGLGSIGQRHVQNLRQLLGENVSICAARTRNEFYIIGQYGAINTHVDVTKKYNIQTFNNLDNALQLVPDVVLVTNPTSLHLSTAITVAKAGCHIFLEKPISHTLKGVDKLQALIAQKELINLVGYQYRFHPGLLQIKKWLDETVIGQIVSVQVHWGEHLADWHPWEDYRQGYSARADLGGGVILTLSHPLDYLRWLLGEVAQVSAMVGYDGLGLDVEDTADITLQFQSGVIGHVHLDYLQRPSTHKLQIVGQKGMIRWDNADGKAHWYESEKKQWHTFSPLDDFERNDLFLRQTKHLLACLEGKETPVCTLQDGIAALRLSLAALQSAREERWITI